MGHTDFVPNRVIQFAFILAFGPLAGAGCAGPWPWSKPPAPMTVARPPTQPPYETATTPPSSPGAPQYAGGPPPTAGTYPTQPAAAPDAAAGASGVQNAAGAPGAGNPGVGFPGSETYPTATDAGAATTPLPNAAGTSPMPAGAMFEPAKTVAIVGNQFVLAGDVEGNVNLIMATALPPETPIEKILHPGPELAPQKAMLFRQQLAGDVQAKIGYVDFLRQVPPDRVPEMQKKINESFVKDLESVREKLAKGNEEELEELRRREMVLMRLAILMKNRQIETLGDLESVLRQYGTSLERQQRAYGEQKLSQMAVMRNIRQNQEITHEEMLAYYHKHYDEYRVPAKAKWEQLTVRLDRYPTREAAEAAIAGLGNEVYLGGAAFGAVAKKGSQEPNAENGGVHDWTNRGSLASTPLDDAIFSLPMNRLSDIIRDDRGLHIVRVLERTEETHTPFVEAQAGIKDKIKIEKRMADYQQYVEKVRKSTYVWTIFDADEAAKSQTPGSN